MLELKNITTLIKLPSDKLMISALDEMYVFPQTLADASPQGIQITPSIRCDAQLCDTAHLCFFWFSQVHTWRHSTTNSPLPNTFIETSKAPVCECTGKTDTMSY